MLLSQHGKPDPVKSEIQIEALKTVFLTLNPYDLKVRT